jgi:Fe-S-cluster containining protein
MNYIEKINDLIYLPDTLCRQCGLCCKVLVYKGGYTYEELTGFIDKEPEDQKAINASYFLELFKPVSLEEAIKIDSVYVKKALAFYPERQTVGFYKCQHIDDSTNCCAIYERRPEACKAYPIVHDSTLFHTNCGYQATAVENWKKLQNILRELETLNHELEETKKSAINEHKDWQDYLTESSGEVKKYLPAPEGLCKGCGTCCRVAFNAIPFEKLKEMVKEGNSLAKDFLYVFEPHSNIEIAKQIAPDHVNRMIQEAETTGIEELTLYHCRFIDDMNRCSMYKERPEFCKNDPCSPWAIVTRGCGYEGWLFSQREQVKKYIRKLKEYYYTREALSEDQQAENVPVETLCRLKLEDIKPFCRFEDYFNFTKVSIDSQNEINNEIISLNDLKTIIRKKTIYWKELFFVT